MRKLVYALLFLAFTAENSSMYNGMWETPMKLVDDVLFRPSPVKLPLFLVIVIVALIASQGGAAKNGRASPMDKAMWVTIASIAFFTAWGAFLGGKPVMAGWQTLTLVMGVLFGKLAMAHLRKPEHWVTMGKVLVAAACWRAMACITFWMLFVHNVPFPKGPPPHMTQHDDTVLFVAAIVLCLVNALIRRSGKATLTAIGVFLLIVVAIQLNNRRLAWASLLFSLIVVYLMQPAGRVRKRINIGLFALLPIIATYVTVGWGRKEKIFKPLASFSSMTTKEDSSTRARNAENKGLHATLVRGGWLMSWGWGQEYVEVDSRYSIAGIYKEWKYIPHNSVLGTLAFTGVFGFAALWMSIPIAVFLHTRTWRNARDPVEKVGGLTGLAMVTICMNQMYGDMGLTSVATQIMLSTSFAAAGRLSVSSGAWITARGGRVSTPTPTPAPAPVGAAQARRGGG